MTNLWHVTNFSTHNRVWLIFWKRRRENLSFHNLMLGKWGWKHVAQQLNFPSPENIIYPTVTENKFNIWNYSFSGPTGIYLFEFSNNGNIIMWEICSKLTIETSHIALVSLMLTLNISEMLFQWGVFCWLWTCKYKIE